NPHSDGRDAFGRVLCNGDLLRLGVDQLCSGGPDSLIYLEPLIVMVGAVGQAILGQPLHSVGTAAGQWGDRGVVQVNIAIGDWKFASVGSPKWFGERIDATSLHEDTFIILIGASGVHLNNKWTALVVIGIMAAASAIAQDKKKDP